MFYNLCVVFTIFIIYSFIGYLLEVGLISYHKKEIVLDRGFLIGPCLPIFGVGALAMTAFLNNYRDDIIVLFILSLVTCTVVEYFGSYILEKIFKLRWWDYKDKKYNINGRVCLENAVFFGIGGVIIIRYANPLIFNIIGNLSNTTFYIITIILFSIFLIDLLVSIYFLTRMNINIQKYTNKDATKAIKEEVKKSLKNISFFDIRILNAFPNVKSIKNNEAFERFSDLVTRTRLEIAKKRIELKEKELELKEKGISRKIKRLKK